MSASPFRQVKASAGSGKTYALTRHFLDLLGRAQSPDECATFACAGAAERPQGYTWPEILAVTFTNKAAAEMQGRVLEALKGIALKPGAETAIPQARAERLLLDILRHASKLGIRTIDSLLNLLMRQFALDQGLRPDFDIEFDERKVLGELLQAFLARCEEPGSAGAEASALYDQAVKTLIEHEDKDGFWLQDALRERMIELTSVLARTAREGRRFTTDQARMADLLAPAYARMKLAAEAMGAAIEGEGLSAAKHFLTLLAKCQEGELFGGLPDSAYLRKEHLDECLNKASKGAASPDARAAFDEFLAASAEYVLAQAILEPAYALAPCVEIGQRLSDGLREHQRDRGCLFGSDLAGRVVSALEDGDGVPDAFCRLGERLHHLLVDEFQDTSADQWRAMLPLAQECLAKGGSLFYVGDVKQAIYAWRGGDAGLFDRVGQDEELTAMSGGLNACSLPDNWRSAPAVIDFNNAMFSRLEKTEEGPDVPRELAEALLSDAPEEVRDDLCEALSAAFAGCAQGFPQSKEAEVPGYVHLRLLPMAAKREVEAMSLDALADIVARVRQRRPLSDMAVLVRTNTHADLVCDRLVREGVPIITENSLLLSRHPLVRQLIALLRVLDAPADDVAFLELVCGSELFLPESGLSPTDMLDWVSGLAPERRRGLMQRFREDFPATFDRLIGPFLRQSGLMRPYDLLCAALDCFQARQRHPEAELYIRRLLEVAHLAEEQGAGSVARLLEFWDEKGAEEKVPLPEGSDAVRILTIHKAKGLQFPVTIVPFHNWPGDRIKEYIPVEHCGHTVLTRLTKALGAPWHRRLAQIVAEQVNLLYVAWTRAEEELYLVSPGVQGKRTLGMVPIILERLVDPPAEAAELDWGVAPPCPAESCEPAPRDEPPLPDIPPLEDAPKFLGWLPRLRVYRHTLDDAGPVDSVDERTRGKLAHKAVELLRTTGDDEADARRATTLALHEFPELRAVAAELRQRLEREVGAMLHWLLAQDELRPALEAAAAPPGSGGGELTILAPDGAFLRPDLLHIEAQGATVLEFKTGAASPDHARQLRTYLELARGLGEVAPGAPVRGYLVYLDRRVVEPVALEGGAA